MADVFTVLAQDHKEVQDMLAELEKNPAGAATSADDPMALRKRMTDELIIEESKHEALEEMYFWPAVREHLPDGDRLADTATQQEQEAKQVLARLDRLEPHETEFEPLLSLFITAAREHITFEETQVWPGMREALSGEAAEEIGTKIAEGKKTAPTRPHPKTPPSPGVLKATGPVAAAADKARDKASGRGTE
jgi:hemerythrin-like domain-containing protein